MEKWKNVSKCLRAVGAFEVQTKIVDSSSESHNINVFKGIHLFYFILEVEQKIHIHMKINNCNKLITLDQVNLAKEWLKSDWLIASFDDILKNWNITFELRNSEITNSINNCNLSDFFESWPILQGLRGYELVCLI